MLIEEQNLYVELRDVDSMLNREYFYELEMKVRIQEAFEDELEEGRAEGIAEVVRAMKSKGFSAKDIADILSIQEEKVESMK